MAHEGVKHDYHLVNPQPNPLTGIIWWLIIFGLLGGLLGGWIFGLLGIWRGGGIIGSLIVAFIGAVILVWIRV